MAKNDFDSDFDYEKEYGFDPKSFLDSEFDDEDLDLSQFDDIQLGLDLTGDAAGEDDLSDFDIDSLDLGGGAREVSDDAEPEEDLDLDLDLEDDFDEEFDDGDEEFDEDEDLDADMNLTRRMDFFGTAEPAQEPEEIDDMTDLNQAPDYNAQPDYEEGEAADEESFDEDIEDEDLEDEDLPDDYDEDEDDEDMEEEASGKPARRTRERKPARERKPINIKPIKLTVPPVLMKLWNLYFPPKETWDPKPDPNAPRRRRKSRQQIFKEFYLPPIIAGVAIVLIFTFLIGSLSNAIQARIAAADARKESEIAASNAAEQIASEYEILMAQAELLAQSYDYQGAVDLLDSFSGDVDDYKELGTKKAEYMAAQSKMVEWKDANAIPNLSFHMLIADPSRAFSDVNLGGKYNRNFVTTDEFSKILEQLYAGGYVLVDFDSFIDRGTNVDGSEVFSAKTIYLPEGKKPIMITQTMVNYMSYMVDSNDDGEADAGGAGFANKLVVENGEIKARYVDINSQTHVGDYDLVPILESFIKAHPDFSYQGARATLAVTGEEGIFGYRINSTYVPTLGQEYVNQEIAGAKELVQALRNKGYTLASFTYGNSNYRNLNANNIKEEMQSWNTHITPVIGNVDILVFAQTSDIDDYNGTKFDVLYDAGFRIFVNNGSATSAQINSTYVRQTRLMVTGNSMMWYSSNFTGIFDTNVVLDLTARGGSVPN